MHSFPIITGKVTTAYSVNPGRKVGDLVRTQSGALLEFVQLASFGVSGNPGSIVGRATGTTFGRDYVTPDFSNSDRDLACGILLAPLTDTKPFGWMLVEGRLQDLRDFLGVGASSNTHPFIKVSNSKAVTEGTGIYWSGDDTSKSTSTGATFDANVIAKAHKAISIGANNCRVIDADIGFRTR